MSSKRSAVTPLVAVCFILGAWSTAHADIVGNSRLDLSMEPIPCTLIDEIKLDTPCEKTLLMFDLESIIDVTLVTEHLSLTTNFAIGIAGLEHTILTLGATIGSIDLISELWFATPFESVVDINNHPNVVMIPPGKILFVKKRVTTIMKLGGVTLRNLAMFEDVTFPNPNADYGTRDCDGDGDVEGTCVKGVETNPATQYQTQSFAFGDLINLTGQTTSGITVTSEIGVCATRASNSVKKFSAVGSVNPECHSQPKPDLLFDYTSLTISGIPLAADLIANAQINCVKVTKCSLTNTLSMSSGLPIPVSTSFTLTDLFSLRLSNSIALVLDSGPATITFSFANFRFSGVSLNYASTLDARNVTAALGGNISIAKGIGITGARLNLSVVSGTFNATHTFSLIRNPLEPGLQFGSFSIRMGLNIAPARITIQAVFGRMGLSRSAVSVGLVF